MSEKPKPGIFSQLLKYITPGGNSGTRTRYCEKGHPMDANWTTCPYCDAEKRKNDKSVIRMTTKSNEVKKSADVKTSETTERSTAMERGSTKIGMNLQEEPRGTTRADTSPQEFPEKKEVARERQITGVLATFSHRFQGDLFILYEGRNTIGSGSACDISIPSDRLMSSEHAMILCRVGRDELHDMLSTNGTFLNEEYVGTKGADLADGAMIKAGSTIFQFRKITSGGVQVQDDRPEYLEDNNRQHHRGETEI
jgi:pSer/pThr/pTyr-binding forkhead associated (FHA) protein